MSNTFKEGDIITPICTVRRGDISHCKEYTFTKGIDYLVDSVEDGIYVTPKDRPFGNKRIKGVGEEDLTGMFRLVPQKSAAQLKAEELREQARVLLGKAVELEELV